MNSKKLFTLGTMALAICMTTATVFAAAPYNTPAEALSGITGKTVEEVVAQRVEAGKSYGTMAKEADKLVEFQEAILEMKKEVLDSAVSAGTLTQEQANVYLKAMKEKQALCDGTGNGMGRGNGIGCGVGNGMGRGQGRGMGRGLRDGSCYTSAT